MKQTALLLLLWPLAIWSQDLPDEWEYQTDDHILNLGKTTTDGLYQVNAFQEIYLEFEEANWQDLLADAYGTEDYLTVTMTINGNVFNDVAVQYKGQTSYLMLPPWAEKMSFSIKTDEINPDQDIEGYNNLNLNNAFQDPSFLREFLYLQLIRNHIPAAKANFANLYINGEYWGPYVNVQQLNKDFLEEWFLSNDGSNWRADNGELPGGGGPGGGGGPNWGDGTAALNYLGEDAALYEEYYTLKSTEQNDPWSLLVNTCNVLNNTPLNELTSALPAVMDVDRALWFLACEIAFADDDSYVYKGKMDYYAYWEVETGRLTPQEFDGNSILGNQNQDWGPFFHADNENYPLLHRLMQVPEYRQRYLAHMRTVVDEMLDADITGNLIETYAAFIDDEVQNDPKSLYPYFVHVEAVNELSTLIANRRNVLMSNAEVNTEGATISNVSLTGESGNWEVIAGETPFVTAEVESADGVEAVWLYFSDEQVGNFYRVPMLEEGGMYTAQLPSIELGGIMRFYIEAIESDGVETRSYLPVGAEHDVFFYTVAPEWVESDLVINELMASNNTTANDEMGEFEDWIELFNKGEETIDLSGYFISDNVFNLNKWEFPAGTVLEAGEYLIVWADDDQSDGPLHANFKLSADGESLTLLTDELKIADQVIYGIQETDLGLARVPNGTGDFVIQQPTFAANNEQSTGLFESAIDLEPSVFPNPAKNLIHVHWNRLLPEQTALNILDASGRMVHSELIRAGSNQTSIDISGLARGVYYCHFSAERYQKTRRLVVK